MSQSSKNSSEDYWFTEGDLPFAQQDISISVRTTKILVDKQSEFGRIQIFDTPFFGRILVLDGIIQIANKTEFIYHEMMVTLPSISQGSPKSILIVGGGDGGAVKHALNIKSVERIVMVEIDQEVIDVCKEFIPEIADGALENKKVELIVGDGLKYVRESKEKFDVIVLDVSDPVPGGPAEALLSNAFYSDVKNLLNENGTVLTHCGSLIFQAEKTKTIVNNLENIFANVTMHQALIPEFELTIFGFLVCSDVAEPSSEEVSKRFKELLTNECQYLSPDVYGSSKVLSPYIEKLTGITNN